MMWAIVFWLGVLIVVMAYPGYGLWVACLAAWRQRPVPRADRDDGDLPALTCVIAARNEAANIDRKLRGLLLQDYPHEKLAIIVVDDGSTDDTARLVSAWVQRDDRITLLRMPQHQGKAAALNAARRCIRSEVTVFMDVRQRLTPHALRELAAHLADPTVGVVSGDLRLAGDLYWRYERQVRAWESRSGSMVQATGALYAIRTADVPDIPAGTILDDVYVPMSVALTGRRIVLAQAAGCIDVSTRSAGSEFVRKVRTLAGLFQICHTLDGCLDPRRNPVWARFVCHKLLRLLSPYGLAMAVVGSFMAPGWLYGTAFDLLLAAMAAAAVAMLGVPWRIFRVVQSFLTLHAAALWALPSYYLGLTSVMWTRVEPNRAV